MADLKPFSLSKYLLITALLFGILIAFLQAIMYPFGYYFLAEQINFGWKKFLLVFVGSSLFLGLFEWAFHRYVLHCIVFRSLQKFAKEHRAHHGLTPRKDYPIIREEQYEHQAFPWFALPIFWLVFSPIFWLLHLLFPNFPWLLGGYLAVTTSLSFYETLHSLEHKPTVWWEVYVGFFVGKKWKTFYNFHHMHHYRLFVNESISGFFGIPIWDLVFGTYYVSQGLLPNGEIDRSQSKAIPKPWPIIQWLDNWATKRELSLKERGLVSD